MKHLWNWAPGLLLGIHITMVMMTTCLLFQQPHKVSSAGLCTCSPKTGLIKNWIPGCPLDKQLPHFASLGHFLLVFINDFVNWDDCLDPCPLGKWAFRVTCPVIKPTCPGYQAGLSSSPAGGPCPHPSELSHCNDCSPRQLISRVNKKNNIISEKVIRETFFLYRLLVSLGYWNARE